MKTIIAASLLAADFARLGPESEAVLEAGADCLHLDVMDQHFVPNLTMGPMICTALRRYGITAPLDVHLMVKPVDALIHSFAKAGATYITIHPESTDHLDRSLSLIREYGCKAGIALNPATPVAVLDLILDKIDLVLLMSVNPGFGGQTFIPYVLEKIRSVHQRIQQSGKSIYLAVDGGINTEIVSEVYRAGANWIVAGTAIFGTSNYAESVQALR